MSQSFSKIILHIVFSTKERKNFIPKSLLPEMHAYLATACRNHKVQAYRVGGTQDHVHLACALSRNISVAELVKDIKATSSKWIKDRESTCHHFAWQRGYAVFSLGFSQLDTLIHYIDHQMEHHQRLSFKEELIATLKKYQIPFKPEYMWE